MERPPYDVAPPRDTMGLRHVLVALEDLEFPTDTRALLARAGEWRIPITGDHFHTLGEMLAGVSQRRFRRPDDVAAAIAKAHPELRE